MRDRWPLTGRADELGTVADILASSDYRGIVLAGEAGVGKSRLARESVARAQRAGWTVHEVAATATARSVPLGAFAHWSQGLEGSSLALANLVITKLTADTGPGRLLVLVDDAHLLDELSALVVHQLVLHRAASVLMTVRTGQRPPDAVTALWKDGHLRRLEVRPLTRQHTCELLESLLGASADQACSQRIWNLTQGNALFLRQLVEQEQDAGRLLRRDGTVVWTGGREVSPSLMELVEHQTGAVPRKVLDVVDFVAIGEPIQVACLMLLVNPDVIEEAEQRGLIRTSADTVQMGHPLYAEVRMKRCGPVRLRRLRGQVAMAMKDSRGPADLARRGLLWMESDLPPNREVLECAAGAAASLLDFGLAERLYRGAADAGTDSDAQVQLAYSLLMQRKGDDAEEILDAIPAHDVASSAFINDVILRAANLLWSKRDPAESWRVIDAALIGATGERAAQLLAFRANQLALAGRPAAVIEVLAGVHYGLLDDFGATIGLCAETLAYGELGRPDEACVKAAACYRVVRKTPHGSFLAQPLTEFHAFALAVAGRTAEAVDVAERHRCDSSSEPATAQSVASSIAGMAALFSGDLRAAAGLLPVHPGPGMAEADFLLVNSFQRFYLLRAQVLARLGKVEEAESTLEAAREYGHAAYEYVETTGILAQAWVAAARHRLVQARQFACQAAEFARDHGQAAREVWCLQTAVQFGDTAVVPRLAELAAVVDGPRAALAWRYAAALASDDTGELDELSKDFEAMGDLLAAADSAAHASSAHRRAGRRGSGATSYTRAEKLASRCGGATSPAIVGAQVAIPFTQREREIAVLVVQGLTNREIAEAMSLSVRTVEGYVYQACAKAGVAKRTELSSVLPTAVR
ncbi:helix-turn-helix transcriptional regulator [Mycolicibacterium komossense]|uniref:LuxR family transcriptional regulator n=1 Tax=Mycolicibacterium komossense TaxID=1779 RepID=A0ABT3C6Y0_9MYCO|nr:LuxR family transcriptional regulator [Mycolicibacterium komossense]MCV7225191.1 LuxR family transcriptional regulator [Mycolicibacterium komossense]